MRVLIVSAVFPPEPVVSAQTSAQIAQELVQRKDAVRVITDFPHRPAGRLYPGYGRRLIQHEAFPEGYQVTRCFSVPSVKSSMLSRFLENISFGVTGGVVALTSPRPDVIYANTWAIFAVGILLLVARLRRVPLVISVQDVYPESLIIQGHIRTDGWLARWLHWMDRTIARRCSDVIVISERFAEIYRGDRGVAAERVHVVPNWVDDRFGVPDEQGRRFRAEAGIPADAFLFVYGGNIGLAAGVEGVIEAFRYLPNILPARLLVAGAGPSLSACQALADRVAGDRVAFYTPWPAEKTAAVYGAADVLVLPTRGQQSLVSVPSKLISYMLAARPVIALAVPGSDLALTVEQAGCGWVVEPDQPEALAAVMREVVAALAAERARRGEAGREYALRHLIREINLPRVVEVLDKAAQEGGHRGPSLQRM